MYSNIKIITMDYQVTDYNERSCSACLIMNAVRNSRISNILYKSLQTHFESPLTTPPLI